MTYQPRQRQFGNKRRTQQDKRVALQSLLVMRRTLDGLTAEDLARTHGLPVAECGAALEAQRAVREARG
jgi:hypothetical protein